MKKVTYLTLITNLLITFNSYADQDERKCKTLENLEGSRLGQVIYSILNEDKIQKIYGKEWVLMAGQTESDLGIRAEQESVFKYLDSNVYGLKTNKLPNPSGLFFRISGNSKPKCTGSQNPNTADCSANPSDQTIGSYQGDSFRSHRHKSEGKWARVLGGGGDAVGYPGHKSNTTATGGNETRPKNLTVNAFVKIKLKCLDKDRLYTLVKSESKRSKQALNKMEEKHNCATDFQFKKKDSPEASLEKLNKLWSAELKEKVGDTRIDFEDNFKDGKRIGTLNQYLAGEKNWSLACVMQTVNSIISILTYHDEFIDGKKGSNGFKFDYQDALKSYLIQEFPLYPSRFELLNENKKIVL